MRVTRHGKKRMKQRIGVSKGFADEFIQRAWEEGLSHSQVKGELKAWMDKEYLLQKQANNCRFYAGKLFIFCNKILVTILDGDMKFERNLQDYVKSMKIYITYKRNRIKRKTNPELERNLRNEFADIIRDDLNAQLLSYCCSDKSDYFYYFVGVSNLRTVQISFTNKDSRDKEFEDKIKRYIRREYDFGVEFVKRKEL